MSRIVIMDDRRETVEPLSLYLSAAGHEVKIFETQKEVQDIFSIHKIDLAILDMDLMEQSEIDRRKSALIAAGLEPLVFEERAGLEVATWIRRIYPETAVIIYSSQKVTVSDQIEGLQEGADEYITKGDELPLVVARIEALLRRRKFSSGDVALFAGIEVNLRTRQVKTPLGEEPKLTDAEFRLLSFLIENHGSVHAKEVLYRAAFRQEIPSEHDRAIDTLVAKLRKKIQPDAGRQSCIATVHGAGYRLDATVSLH